MLVNDQLDLENTKPESAKTLFGENPMLLMALSF